MKTKLWHILSMILLFGMLLPPATLVDGAAAPVAEAPAAGPAAPAAQPPPPEDEEPPLPKPPAPGEPDGEALGTTGAAFPTIPPPPKGYGGPVVLRNPTVTGPVTPGVFDGDLRDLPRAKPEPGPPREIPIFLLHGKTSRPGTTSETAPGVEPRSPKGKGAVPGMEPASGFEGPLAAPEAEGSFAPVEPAWVGVPSSAQNWEGMSNGDNYLVHGSTVAPPDTVGDVGPNHYVQMVNLLMAIYDKNGNQLVAPFDYSALWNPVSQPNCYNNNNGDPIVLYDHLADRWLISYMAWPGPYYECIAISQTGDPTGAWWTYEFLYSNTKPNDYPKLGVWPDGYYMSVNQFDATTGAWSGAGVCVFERSKMLNGQLASMQCFNLGNNPATFYYGGLLPSDLDGPAPPAGTPNYFAAFDADEWGWPYDMLHIWEFHVDWSNPANTTFTGPLDLPTEPFDPEICPAFRGQCIPQPGGAPALESLSDRLMHRLAYRYFGDHETLVVNHTVKVQEDPLDPDPSGVRWYELRKSGGGNWVIYQQDTYAPDSNYRWMGSVAMDGDGNIAIGYSVSSESLYPSIRYTGRKAGDPLNTTPRREQSIKDGVNSQTGTARWGDYSAMSVDPVDDCTFWYTQEYVYGTIWAPWRTRIASFKFPSCAAPHQIYGTVYDATTLRGLPWTDYGTEVIVNPAPTGERDSYIPGSGGYYHSSIVTGTYDVTARAYGYQPNTIAGVSVAGSVQVDIPLNPANFWTVSGAVTDANTGYPVRARITVTGDPFDPPSPDNQTWSEWLNGSYSLTLAEYVTYTFRVEAVGYLPVTRTVGPLTGNTTENFALTPDLSACTAPGYEIPYLLNEDFDPGGIPGTWTVVDNAGTGCVWVDTDPDGRGNLTGGSGRFAIVDSDWCGFVSVDTELQSPAFDASGVASLTLEFKSDYYTWTGADFADVDVWDGSAWNNVLQWTGGSVRGPHTEQIDITTAAGGATDARVRFHYYNANYEWWWEVDDVQVYGCAVASGAILEPENIQAEGCPCAPQTHKITFVNHTGLTDTVNITYTTSPSVTVLSIPSTLGVIPDGGIRPFSVTLKIDSGTPPSTTVYVTVTASLAGSPAISDTMVIEKHVTKFEGWEFTGDTDPWGGGAYPRSGCTAQNAAGDWVTFFYGDATGTMTGLWGYNHTQGGFTQYTPGGTPPPYSGIWAPAWAYDAANNLCYMTGGATSPGAGDLATVYVYDPVADAWLSPLPNFTTVRDFHAAFITTLNGTSDFLCVVGGINSGGDLASTQCYDFSTSTWNAENADIPALPVTAWGMGYAQRPTTGSGEELWIVNGVLGGAIAGNSYYYDTITGAWVGPQTMDTALYRTSALAFDGEIYNLDGDTGWFNYSDIVQRYDDASGTWVRIQNDLTARMDNIVAATPDGIWSVSGYGADGNVNLLVPCPDCGCRLALEKSGPEWVYQGEVAGYTILLQSSGELTATALLTDVIPAGATYADNLSCSDGTCSYDAVNGAVYWDVAVAPYDVVTLTFDVTATASISTWVVNTATVTYCGGDLVDTHEFHVSRPPSLTWDKEVSINGGAWQDYTAGPFSVTPGDTVDIRETLSYTGTFSLFTTITETWGGYPVTITAEAHTVGAVGWLPGGDYGWGVTMLPGESQTLTKTFQVTDTGLITIAEWLQPDYGISPYGRDVVLSSTCQYSLTLTPPTAALSGNPGSTVTYTLRVTNTGNCADTFTVVVRGNAWTTNAPATVGPLAAGDGADLQVTVDIPATAANGDYDTATVTVTSQGDNTKSDSSTLTTTAVVACVDVSGADFTFAPTPAQIGETVTFTGSVAAGTTPITYTWAFGDGGTGSGQVVTHTYTITGTFTVVMTATNACPSTDTASHGVTVEPRYIYLPVVFRDYQ